MLWKRRAGELRRAKSPWWAAGHTSVVMTMAGVRHPIAAPFSLDRFRTGRLIDEAAAAAVAH